MNTKNKISAITNLLYGGMLMQEIVGGVPAKRPEVRMSNSDGRGATAVTTRNCNAQRRWGCQLFGQITQPNMEPDVLVRCVNSGIQESTGLIFRTLRMDKPILTVKNALRLAKAQ